ncbi:MAG: hypothetical protein K0Q55_1076, partial [Verrucomicrobia bacterium]|nr:hypothetical protein [Verrucomicrobiota bacterium]
HADDREHGGEFRIAGAEVAAGELVWMGKINGGHVIQRQ